MSTGRPDFSWPHWYGCWIWEGPLVSAWHAFTCSQPSLVPIGGLALILGNRFPCFHQFRGGKGVANYLGYTTIIAPLAAGISALAWLAAVALFRIPFVGSFVMVFILGAGTLLACNFDPLSTTAVLATVALIYYGHRRNVVEQIQKRRAAKINRL